MDAERIEKSKAALLKWHQKLLPEAYGKDSYFYMLRRGDLQVLCDDLLDAALSLEEQGRIAEAALASIRDKTAA